MHLESGKLKRFEDNCPALAVFTFLFAWAHLFDLQGSIALLPNLSAYSPSRLLMLTVAILAIWTILKPSSLFRSIPFFLVSLIQIIIQTPLVPNHKFYQIAMLITILTCFIYSQVKERDSFTQTKLFELLAPVLRLQVVVIYLWAAFHKLNTGFLDYKISCATVQMFSIKDVIPVFPTPDWFLYINPYLTLLIEGLIPILLIIPKTRIYGLILGFCFHFILGFVYNSFTVFVFSLYSLFIPPSSYDRIKLRVEGLREKIWGRFSHIITYTYWRKPRLINYITQFVLILLIVFILRIFIRGGQKSLVLLSTPGLYLILCIILGVAFFYYVVRGAKELGIDEKIAFIPKKKWLFIFPAIVFINGLFPHIGLKNIQVIAMYSNLRTEGGKTNHLLIPSSFQLFDHLEDLVLVKASNYKPLNQFSGYASKLPTPLTYVVFPRYYVEYLNNQDEDFRVRFRYKIPYVMLRNIVTELSKNGIKNIALLYERGGEVFYTKNADADPLMSNASIFQIKFLSQRAVPDDERGLCMW